MGDPAGIGPEIILKALAQEVIYRQAMPIVIGDGAVLERAKGYVCSPVRIRRIGPVGEVTGRFGEVEVLDLKNVDLEKCPPGVLSAEAGRAAVECIFRAIDFARANELDAVVTAPLNKEAIHLAGYRFAGHTEIFAERTGSRNYALMLVAGRLRVLHVSTHVSLREACDRVRKDRVLQVIHLAHDAAAAWGLRRPRIGVAGLNPHAGEQGIFGHEEREEIAPAVAAARAEGIDAVGPVPPDTLFYRALKGEFDFVVAMYHDQGHIPVKLRSFDRAVNVTVGLPIIRTSVDHGTAFDIAGKGTASPRSLVEALRLAIRMARRRRQA
ncbi:MAG: 4-hydroxythreonine-4-phosphate dehydrogenase PdxA [candidate division NC10 bacterium]|nr:4-hydroxythreonine-4-phosphate dehydrogenase PdxA [candidate division NC10 bacterium]